MIKQEQTKTLENDSIIEQLHLILNKIEELDLRMAQNPGISSKSKQAAWSNWYRRTLRGGALATPFLYQINERKKHYLKPLLFINLSD